MGLNVTAELPITNGRAVVLADSASARKWLVGVVGAFRRLNPPSLVHELPQKFVLRLEFITETILECLRNVIVYFNLRHTH